MEHKYWNGTNYITGRQVVTQIKNLKAISENSIVGWYYFPTAADFNMSLDDFPPLFPFNPIHHTHLQRHFYLYKDNNTAILVVKGASHISEALDREIIDLKGRYNYYWDFSGAKNATVEEVTPLKKEYELRMASYHAVLEIINKTYVTNGHNGARSFNVQDTYYCSKCGTQERIKDTWAWHKCPICDSFSNPIGTLLIHDAGLLDHILCVIGGEQYCQSITITELIEIFVPLLTQGNTL